MTVGAVPGVIDLGGDDWQFASVPARPLWQCDDLHLAQDWLPATVPGNAEADLLSAGRLPDPYWATSNEAGRWVENLDWWYRREAVIPLGEGQRAHLVMRGVDYHSAVYVNGRLLGCHEGMFSQQVYDVTDLLRQGDGKLDLAVRLWGAHALPKQRLSLWQRIGNAVAGRVFSNGGPFPDRIETLKCQMSFGWDFAPRLPTVGIWDDAELVVSGPVFVSDVWVRATSQGSCADVRVLLGLDAAQPCLALLALSVEAENCHDAEPLVVSFAAKLRQGHQETGCSFQLPSPRLWQPWDRGEANLYRLQARVTPDDGALPSETITHFGVRSVSMANDPGHAGKAEQWPLIVNGEPEFVRGLNWVPLDALPGRVRGEHYAAMIARAKQANANMLRVWGGGLREKRAFYDLCDREGMLVWQEFPLACPNLRTYPRQATFMDKAAGEAASIVRQLRNHPSVVLWCGGNEFSPRQNRALVERLQRAVQENDGTRPFRPSSPSPGDNHNWRVWHRYAPVADYRKEGSPLVSEFGLQSAPARRSLQKFIPDDALWPPGSVWRYHNAEIKKLWRYARALLRDGNAGLEGFIEATQATQALGIQALVEHMRRRKPMASGVIVWQLNEPWPSICWSVIDFFSEPKAAYHVVERVFSPLLISVEYDIRKHGPGEAVAAAIWLINDTMAALTRCEVRLLLNNAELHRQQADMEPNSSKRVGSLRFMLPHGPPPWVLRAELWQEDSLLSWNEYDLSYYDGETMPPVQRLIALVTEWMRQYAAQKDGGLWHTSGRKQVGLVAGNAVHAYADAQGALKGARSVRRLTGCSASVPDTPVAAPTNAVAPDVRRCAGVHGLAPCSSSSRNCWSSADRAARASRSGRRCQVRRRASRRRQRAIAP